jgi:DNA-binding IclR family transcriptional regulator
MGLKTLRRRDAGEPLREIARSYNLGAATVSRLTE